MLAYVVVVDALDEYYHMGENITNKHKFYLELLYVY
jgi:hypothetical protein